MFKRTEASSESMIGLNSTILEPFLQKQEVFKVVADTKDYKGPIYHPDENTGVVFRNGGEGTLELSRPVAPEYLSNSVKERLEGAKIAVLRPPLEDGKPPRLEILEMKSGGWKLVSINEMTPRVKEPGEFVSIVEENGVKFPIYSF